MLGACVSLPGCCCPLSHSRSFTVLLPHVPHDHCSSWGRALHGVSGGDFFLRRLEDPFMRDLGTMMNYASNTK